MNDHPSHYRIALITDSTCDIPNDLLAKYDIDLVPLFIIWGTEEFRDRLDIQPEQFYRRLVEDARYPTTAQPTPEHFAAAYRAAQQKGAEEIVVVTLSSAMSGTFGSAQQAANMVDIPVHVVDAKGPTMTVGWQVLAAARMREAGGDAVAMVAAAARARASMAQFVCLDTVEYLYKGGRIGGATRLISSLLNIKPLIYIDHAMGIVEAAGRARTRKRALAALYEKFFQQLDTSKTLRVAVLHGDALEDAQDIAKRIQREFAPAEMLINTTGPVLGVHTGPHAVALCGYTED